MNTLLFEKYIEFEKKWQPCKRNDQIQSDEYWEYVINVSALLSSIFLN